MKKRLGFLYILLVLPALVWAFDFGVILDQSMGRWGYGDSSSADYTGSLIPRFSALLGDRGDIYISAGMVAEFANEKWNLRPELLRTEFSWLFDMGDIRAGRIYYSDPLGFIADGLFDGAKFSYDTHLGTFGVGAWYTGFLYKSRANITMTASDMESYNTPLDYDDFFNTYFAPSRLIYVLDWEHPNIGAISLRPSFSFLGQFDLTGNKDLLHSQYFIGRLSLPINAFLFSLGGSLGLIQDSGVMKTAFAAEARTAWTPPTPFTSRLSLLGRYSSGESGGVSAFLPVTKVSQGSILQANISGITMLSLEYIARLNQTFSIGLSSSYFIRNDLETYNSYLISSDENEGYYLGNEFFGRIFWSPLSDVSINIGCGIFQPSMGNVAPDAVNQWRIELGLVLSLY